MWFEGTSHRYTSPGTKVKVICKGQDQIHVLGSCFSKDGCFRDISLSQTHLVLSDKDLRVKSRMYTFRRFYYIVP